MTEARRVTPDSDERLAWDIAEFASRPGVYAMAAFGDAALPSDVEERRVQFGDDERQYLVFSMPSEPLVAGFAYLLHGGGWQSGDAGSYRFMARFLAGRGIPAAVGGYRHAPGSRYPAQLEDSIAGYRAACETAVGFGGPMRAGVIGGQSAGAHLAALAAADPRVSGDRPPCGVELSGLLLVSGPLDLEVACGGGMCGLIEELMGSARGPIWDEADPVCRISRQHRFRVLAVHGAHDPLVPVDASRSYVEQTNALRPSAAELVVADSAHHADLVRMFLGDGCAESETMVAWLRAVLGA
ncbi:MAG: alpha/beta hydrolase [Actinomycetota bacterium]|nr:alpha/beta hydrolase [Actinomycetota bacterium]